VVTVISHNKKGVRGYGDRAKVVPRSCPARDNTRIQVSTVRIVHWLSVQVDFLVADFDNIPLNPDDPFYKILFRVFGKFENNNIPTLWF